MQTDVIIAGAGPAGSSLAIRLAAAGSSVCLIDKDVFPRHKLCGEFISPECLPHFERLGVSDQMDAAGGCRLTETLFFTESGRFLKIPTGWLGSSGALSLSRYEMDRRMLDRARQLGVDVFERSSVVELLTENGVVSGVVRRDAGGSRNEIRARAVIDATGRAAALNRLLAKGRPAGEGRAAATQRPRFVAFKAHLREIDGTSGRCEIYSFRGGYGGLSPVESGLWNFCFVVRAEIARRFSGNVPEILRAVVFRNRRASKTLLRAPDEQAEWLAVALNAFGRFELCPADGLFAVGDAASFIDPFTGSGMLLALESSELLADCLLPAANNISDARRLYGRRYARRFGSRLRAASILRRAAYSATLASILISAAGVHSIFGESMARLTRRRPFSGNEYF